MRIAIRLLVPFLLATAACGDDGGDEAARDVLPIDLADTAQAPAEFTVVTFNVGTTDNLVDHSLDTCGYSPELAAVQSAFFGNNLAFKPAIAGARQMFDALKPDIVAFQELYWDEHCAADCEEIAEGDPELHAAACESRVFPCGDPEAQDPVVRRVLGPDYAIACAPDHPDNCIGVRKAFGAFAIPVCPDGPCMDALDGLPPPNGCTRGARVATAVVQVHGGPEITVVDVHTTAGLNQDCRKAQFQQVFEDRGDGRPAAYGTHNLVMGDMNIDPFDADQAKYDASAKYWNTRVGDGKPFHYLSSSDGSGPMTHVVSLARLDHVVSDTLAGACTVQGVSEGTSGPQPAGCTYFDHRPLLCTVQMPR